MPQQPIEENDARFIRMEDKLDRLFDNRVTRTDFEDLRKELQASFVLKAVFDVWSTRLTELETASSSRMRDAISVGGGLFGLVGGLFYLLIYIIQHFH